MTKDRLFAMYRMQDYMDSLSQSTFNDYLEADEATRREMENGTVLRYYQAALEKVLRELPGTKVGKGTVAIWHLYNMGYIVKTPTRCFAIDIKHPEASRLVPYIDFMKHPAEGLQCLSTMRSPQMMSRTSPPRSRRRFNQAPRYCRSARFAAVSVLLILL